MTAFCASFDAPFNAIRTAHHTARQIYPATREQLAHLARTHALAAEFHFRHFARDETELAAESSEQFDIACAIMTEREALAEINLAGMQAIHHHVFNELFGA